MMKRACVAARHVVCLIALGFVSFGAISQETMLEDFESRVVGPIAGQAGWSSTAYGSVNVVQGRAYQGTQSLVLTGGTAYATLLGRLSGYTAKSATLSTYIRAELPAPLTADTTPRVRLVLRTANDTVNIELCHVGGGLWNASAQASTGNCGAGSDAVPMETWSRLEIEVEFETQSVRARLENGAWSAPATYVGGPGSPYFHSLQVWQLRGTTDIDRIAISSEPLSPEGDRPAWSFQTLVDTVGMTRSPPVVNQDGTIYLSTSAHSVNPDTPSLLAFSPEGSLQRLIRIAVPFQKIAIAPDGTIYGGAFGSSGGTLYSLSPDGRENWVFSAPQGFDGRSLAIAEDGTVYISTTDVLYAIDPKTGQEQWSLTTICGGQDPVIAADGTIYATGCNSTLLALNPNGTTRWSRAVVYGGPKAVDSDGTIYVPGYDSVAGTRALLALNPDGSRKWAYPTSVTGFLDFVVIGSDRTIYFTHADLYQPLIALYPSGTFKWSYAVQDWGFDEIAVAKDGTIYGSGSNEPLTALSPDGVVKWTLGNGYSFVTLTRGGRLIASRSHLLTVVDTVSGGLADSPWPMKGHDPYRSYRQRSASIPSGGTVEVSITGQGTGVVQDASGQVYCQSSCSTAVNGLYETELVATPASGSMFIGWDSSSCPPPSRICTVSLDPTNPKKITARFELLRASDDPKIIFVGICGSESFIGSNECSPGAGWFDPRWTEPYRNFNALNDASLAILGESYSGLIAAGLRIGTEWPNSIVLLAEMDRIFLTVPFTKGKVADYLFESIIKPNYRQGDTVVLMGFSTGGALSQALVGKLSKHRIPVLMAGWIDAVGIVKFTDVFIEKTPSTIEVPDNVVRAFNYFYPQQIDGGCFVTGVSRIEKTNRKGQSDISNEPIYNPIGPSSSESSCKPHEDMDNDRLTWEPMLKYVLESWR